jgi:hypothetical protein
VRRPTPRRGWFVTFEGPEGAGKTEQARRLHDLAVEAGLPVVLTREPGGTPLGEAIRGILLAGDAAFADPRADALLFNAARAQLVAEVIGPALGASSSSRPASPTRPSPTRATGRGCRSTSSGPSLPSPPAG